MSSILKMPSEACYFYQADFSMLRSLTDEPGTNDTITLFVTAFGLEGNTVNVEPLLQYDKGVHNLTRANYGHQYQTRINVTGNLLLNRGSCSSLFIAQACTMRLVQAGQSR